MPSSLAKELGISQGKIEFFSGPIFNNYVHPVCILTQMRIKVKFYVGYESTYFNQRYDNLGCDVPLTLANSSIEENSERKNSL